MMFFSVALQTEDKKTNAMAALIPMALAVAAGMGVYDFIKPILDPVPKEVEDPNQGVADHRPSNVRRERPVNTRKISGKVMRSVISEEIEQQHVRGAEEQEDDEVKEDEEGNIVTKPDCHTAKELAHELSEEEMALIEEERARSMQNKTKVAPGRVSETNSVAQKEADDEAVFFAQDLGDPEAKKPLKGKKNARGRGAAPKRLR